MQLSAAWPKSNKFNNGDMQESKKHPLLRLCYAGCKALVALIRLEYCIMNSRSCMACFCYRPKLEKQLIGYLPTSVPELWRRLLRTDQNVNRDRGKVPIKVYLAVFFCMSTKAIRVL